MLRFRSGESWDLLICLLPGTLWTLLGILKFYYMLTFIKIQSCETHTIQPCLTSQVAIPSFFITPAATRRLLSEGCGLESTSPTYAQFQEFQSVVAFYSQ